jgi:uncharacterized protein with ParB-like and HNH nuclease domain
MKIELQKIKIKDLIEGYKDDGENGVVGYGGKLDIRPKFQREFIYKNEQKKAVINTVLKEFPLNSMYWTKKADVEDMYEVLDGQQRILSICTFYDRKFSININGNM